MYKPSINFLIGLFEQMMYLLLFLLFSTLFQAANAIPSPPTSPGAENTSLKIKPYWLHRTCFEAVNRMHQSGGRVNDMVSFKNSNGGDPGVKLPKNFLSRTSGYHTALNGRN